MQKFFPSDHLKVFNFTDFTLMGTELFQTTDMQGQIIFILLRLQRIFYLISKCLVPPTFVKSLVKQKEPKLNSQEFKAGFKSGHWL